MQLRNIFPDRVRRLARPSGRRNGETDRVYAIGDIHGRSDLLARMITLITNDHAARGRVPARLVLLGDVIDRGPNSARLVEWCKVLTGDSDRFIVLRGNHEAMMVGALAGDLELLEFWLGQGGRETLASWGLPDDLLDDGASYRLMREARRAVGSGTLSWMSSLPVMDRHGAYAFVHAGIRPGVGLDRQAEEDLLWIRSPFLQSADDHGAVVVHGHTICEEGPVVRKNRIGIDTGAHRTGVLTAIGIEGDEFWFLSTADSTSREVGRDLLLSSSPA